MMDPVAWAQFDLGQSRIIISLNMIGKTVEYARMRILSMNKSGMDFGPDTAG